MDVKDFYPLFIANQQRFTTDSRKLQPGDVFFALKGDNFNGNAYAKQVLENGASYVVVDENIGIDSDQVVAVDDVLTFIQSLANHHRLECTFPILAIAGSNGKTTTKELLIHTLQTEKKVHATKGNFNNHIGVPITLLEMPTDTEIGLIEIGTNSFGEIAFLCDLLQPDFGLITNIGKEHLEGFGDIEGVAREESELYHFLQKNNGFAFVNADDAYLGRMSHRLTNSLKYSIEDENADIYVEVKRVAPQLSLHFQGNDFSSSLSGKHNAQNIAATIAVCSKFGISPENMDKGLESYKPTNNRSQTMHIGTNSFLMDAYNANPSSMLAAIETFGFVDSPNKVIVLGDMFEIGDNAREEHKDVLTKAIAVPNCQVLVAGEIFNSLAKDMNVTGFETTEEITQHIQNQGFNNTWFLVKGSRGMKLENILQAFE